MTPPGQNRLEESLLNNTKLESSQQSGNRSERSTLQKCPCGLSDRTSSYITCANCSQDWHNKCCNLKGVTAGAIKKLDEWECPRCYFCPHVDIKINVTDTAPWEESEAYKTLMQGISRIEACNKDKLEEHSRQQDQLVKDLAAIKEHSTRQEQLIREVAEIREHLTSGKNSETQEQLVKEVSEMRQSLCLDQQTQSATKVQEQITSLEGLVQTLVEKSSKQPLVGPDDLQSSHQRITSL